MRKMKSKHGTVLNVVDWWMTINMWEYYISDQEDETNNDIVLAMVCGFEDEMGDISKAEVRPYVKMRTSNMNEIQPAPGWQWID